MKVWVFVEGPSDQLALETLWAEWLQRLHPKGWGIKVIPLESKARFLKKVGPHAALKLVEDPRGLVVGLPDLHPNRGFSVEYQHAGVQDLCALQRRLVKQSLEQTFGQTHTDMLDRFHPSSFKHDAEMLLLASHEALRAHLGANTDLGKRRKPEDQNQGQPPKRVVETLYRTYRRRAYRETVDMAAVLRKVSSIRNIVYSPHGQVQCPVFKSAMDWIAGKTGVSWS